MNTANLVHAIIQTLHNFGAALALGGPMFLLMLGPCEYQAKKALRIFLAAWVLQTVTGGTFLGTTYMMYGQLPEISQIAWFSMYLKIGCVLSAISYCSYHLYRKTASLGKRDWMILFYLAAVAQVAAATQRWYS